MILFIHKHKRWSKSSANYQKCACVCVRVLEALSGRLPNMSACTTQRRQQADTIYICMCILEHTQFTRSFDLNKHLVHTARQKKTRRAERISSRQKYEWTGACTSINKMNVCVYVCAAVKLRTSPICMRNINFAFSADSCTSRNAWPTATAIECVPLERPIKANEKSTFQTHGRTITQTSAPIRASTQIDTIAQKLKSSAFLRAASTGDLRTPSVL